jgi:hypothetical protein
MATRIHAQPTPNRGRHHASARPASNPSFGMIDVTEENVNTETGGSRGFDRSNQPRINRDIRPRPSNDNQLAP